MGFEAPSIFVLSQTPFEIFGLAHVHQSTVSIENPVNSRTHGQELPKISAESFLKVSLAHVELIILAGGLLFVRFVPQKRILTG